MLPVVRENFDRKRERQPAFPVNGRQRGGELVMESDVAARRSDR